MSLWAIIKTVYDNNKRHKKEHGKSKRENENPAKSTNLVLMAVVRCQIKDTTHPYDKTVDKKSERFVLLED